MRGEQGPVGPQGPAGPQGAPGPSDTPEQVLEKLNTAVEGGGSTMLGEVEFSEPKVDLRWAMMHSAAAGACAAASPVSDSSWGQMVLPRRLGKTCAEACSTNANADYTICRASIAIGFIKLTQAESYTEPVGFNQNYSCQAQSGGDEVLGYGLDLEPKDDDAAAVYCCCSKK